MTCSEYGRQALERHNSVWANVMVLGRLRRCRPGWPGPFTDPAEQRAGS